MKETTDETCTSVVHSCPPRPRRRRPERTRARSRGRTRWRERRTSLDTSTRSRSRASSTRARRTSGFSCAPIRSTTGTSPRRSSECSTYPHFSFVIHEDRTHSESLADGLESFAGVNGAQLEVKARDAKGVEARYFTKGPIKMFDDSVEFDVRFSALLFRVPKAVPASDADRAAAAASPQAATYEAYLKACPRRESRGTSCRADGRGPEELAGTAGREADRVPEERRARESPLPPRHRAGGRRHARARGRRRDRDGADEEEGGTWKIVKERQTDRKSGSSWNLPF